MPLARKLWKKKNLIGVCYFALFSLIIMITSFKRIWHLRELVFIKGRSPGSLVRCFPLFALWGPLTRTDPCRRRKWNCMQWKNQTGIVHTSFWVHGHPHSRDFETRPWYQVPRKPSSTRPLSNNFFFFFVQLQRYKGKVFYYRHYTTRGICELF